ncbi:MAG: phosphodiester glycosidase family protein [Candidatus Nanoarchaeia archaeon]
MSNLSRRDLLALGPLGALLYASEADAGSSISVETKSWKNGNHALIMRAGAGSYRAEMVMGIVAVGKAFATTREVGKVRKSSVAFNGSFYETDGSPSGFYLVNGKKVKGVVEGTGGGILYVNKSGELNVTPLPGLERSLGNMQFGMQVNLLVSEGVKAYSDATSSSTPKVPRTLVGFNEGGIVGVVFKNTNFGLGAEYMVQTHGCKNVVALDGGPSSSAYEKSGKRSFRAGDGNENPVPNFLLFYERT